jgi:hypothetical protein
MKALAKLIWGGITLAAGKIGLVGLITKGIGFATSFAFPGWGALLQLVLSGIVTAVKFLLGQIRIALAECVANPRVFIVIGFAFALGHWHGFDNGYGQGEGDLETYKQEAVVYQKQADIIAADAKSAKEAAEKAEAEKIASEKAAADAAAKAKKAEDELAATKAKADADAKTKSASKAANPKPAARRTRRATSDTWSDVAAQIRRALGS